MPAQNDPHVLHFFASKQTFANVPAIRVMPPRSRGGCVMEGYGPGKLYAELIRLLEKQIEARETDMFVGLTDAELSEYDKRRERIRELLAELEPKPRAAAA